MTNASPKSMPRTKAAAAGAAGPITPEAPQGGVAEPVTPGRAQRRLRFVATPDTQLAAPAALPKGKLGVLLELLRQPEGMTIAAACLATGWQKHSVRGALSGAIGKRLGLRVISAKPEGGVRVYRLAADGER